MRSTSMIPFEARDVTADIGPGYVRRSRTFDGRNVAGTAQAYLEIEWVANVSFTYPQTWTESEAREELSRLLANPVRERCHRIIDEIPDEVVLRVLPQIQEIADYEFRAWHGRHRMALPNTSERCVSLPIDQPSEPTVQEAHRP